MPAKRSILAKKEHKVVANELPDAISQAHSAKSFPEPPEYHQEGFQVNGFKSYTDDYQYLRDPKDKRTKEALKLENRYAKAYLRRPKFAALHRELFREMKSMVGASEVSLPVREGNFWYFTRYEENEEYPLHCRRPCDPGCGINPNFIEEVSEWHMTHQNGEPLPRYPDEVIFLDLNLLMRELNMQYIEIGDMDISFDETKVAVTLDCSRGEEIFTLFIFEIQDVNYRRWLHTGVSDAQKTWTRSLIETGRSIYTPMPSSRSNRSSPASPLSGPRRTLKKRASDGKDKISTGASFPCASFVEDTSPPPRHRCLQKIELFDLAGDVLWVNPTCVVYSVLNEKLRPHQVVFHDTAGDPSDPNAAWICYEEEDEAFWVLTISFTADDRYFIFCCASTEVSRWFICTTENVAIPSGAAAGGVSEHPRGAVLKVPFFCKRMEWMERHARESNLEHAEAVVSTAESNQSVDFRAQCAPTARFPAHGESPVEYHLDHHVRLLGPGEHHGGWIMTSNARGCTNFAVFFLPDENAVFEWETVSPTSPAMGAGDHAIANASEKAPKSPKASAKEAKPPSWSTEAKGMGSDDWPLLFEYDPATKVESVECFEHFLLINVCRDASSEVLFCPMNLIWDWWARTRSREHTPKDPCGPVASNPLVKTAFSGTHNRSAGADDFPRPLRLTQTLLLSSLLLRRGAHLKAGGEWLHVDLHDELMRADESVVVDSDFASVVSPAHPTETVAREGGGFPPPSFFERLAASNAVGDGGMEGAESAPGAAPPPRIHATPLRESSEAVTTHLSFTARTFGLAVSHLLHPTAHYEWRYAGAEGGEPGRRPALSARLLRREAVKGRAYDPAAYYGFVLWVPSDDAFAVLRPVPVETPAPVVQIPVFTICRADRFHPRRNGALVNVYGAYGEGFESDFAAERLGLLDRGFVWAYAAVRGGGELGIPWRNAGRKLQRATSVNDFLSVSSFLIGVGLCAKGLLASSGSSAGGMIVCRAVNAAPDLYLAVSAGAPFVDCLTTLLDDELPLTVTEREEFGDPTTDEKAFDLIHGISPVLTIPSGAVAPNMLLVTSLHDTRVGFWEPMKLAARMRAQMVHGKAVGRFVVLMCDANSGHDGASGRYEHIEEIAREYAFVIDAARREREGDERNGETLP